MADGMIWVQPAPCDHIATYYYNNWVNSPNIGNKFLTLGYREFSSGYIHREFNNLFNKPIITMPPGWEPKEKSNA